MNQSEIDALAIRLGITPEKWPEFWSGWCGCCGTLGQSCQHEQMHCNIPSPDSDDPRAQLWESFLMRALGWPKIISFVDEFNLVEWKALDTLAGWHKTPTAALYAALKARDE